MNKENKENLIPVKGLSPFKRFCMTIGELPSSYLETMTYYEMLVWFTKYMQDTVIPTINNNASAVDELQNKYIEFTDNLLERQTNYEEEVMTLFNNLQDFVNNYFNNLDVQEEINNKLDDMVEQGTLQEIIADYLNSKAIFGFNNVSSMKQATNLIDGSYARTLGYYNINDGGSGLYKIREITNSDVVDEGSIIAIGTGDLIAELVPENNSATPNQFGAYGDGIHDDILALNKCKTYCLQNKILFKGVSKSIYGVSEGFTIETGTSFDFEMSTIKALNTMTYVIRQHKPRADVTTPIDNEYTKNIIIDCDGKADYGFYQDILGWSTYTDNIRVLNPLLIGIYIYLGQIRLYNSKVENKNSNNCVGLQVDSNDSEYYNIVTRDCTTGIKMIGGTNTFNECHPVMFFNELEGSIGFDIYAKNDLINCYADTFMYGIYQRAQSGFECINFKNVINTNYYTPERASTPPYLLYSANNSVDWTSRLTMIGCSMNTSEIFTGEYTRFSNYTKWNGASLRLNNPQFNLNQFATNLPKEIRQNVSQIPLGNYISQDVTIGTARCIINGNCSIIQLINVTLPNVTADGIQYLCEGIPELYLGEQTIEKYITTKNGVVCLLQFRTNGGISIKPVTSITAGDTLNIYEMILK